MKKIIVGSMAAAATALALSPTASADSNDDAFLFQLRSEGINYTSEAFAIQLAHVICSDLEGGASVVAEASLLKTLNNRTGWYITDFNSGYVVGSAQLFYCPDTMGRGA